MIECFLITKTDGSILYSAHYGGNQSLTTVQETEATIYRLTNQNWNHAKGGNFDVAYAEDRLIVFTNVDDLLFFAVKSTKNSYEDDELSLMDLLERVIEALTQMCNKKGLSSASLQEQYPLACLTVAEYVRDGVADQLDVTVADDLAQFKHEKIKK